VFSTGLQLALTDPAWSLPQGDVGRVVITVGGYSQAHTASAITETSINIYLGWDEAFFESFARSWRMTVDLPRGTDFVISLHGTMANANLLADCVDVFVIGDGGGTNPF